MATGEREERPLPDHPYRDSAIVYGIMAVILVVLAGVTGGSLVKATGAAVVFWFAACAWSWWKFRRRIRERELEAAAAAATAEVGVAGAGAAQVGETGVEESPSSGGGRANGSVNGAINGNGDGSGRGRDAGPRGTEP